MGHSERATRQSTEMSGRLFDRYGAILPEDVEVLEDAMRHIVAEWNGNDPRVVNVLEIGMHDGATARGIETYFNLHGVNIHYIGVDPDDGTTRFRYVPNGATVIVGDSAEVFARVPGDLDLVWIDGCHCMNHVMLDTIHFAPKVRPGGFMLFHDVNPRGQGLHHQYHGPETPEFGLATDLAHAAIGFPWSSFWKPWDKWIEKIPAEVERTDCGTRSFRKGTA